MTTTPPRRPGRYGVVTFRSAKRCPKCGLTDQLFGRNRYRPDGLADYCANCRRDIQREQDRVRKAKYAAARSHPADDGARYVAPKPTAGAFPCKAKDCEFDDFGSAATLECHVRLRHSEPAA